MPDDESEVDSDTEVGEDLTEIEDMLYRQQDPGTYHDNVSCNLLEPQRGIQTLEIPRLRNMKEKDFEFWNSPGYMSTLVQSDGFYMMSKRWAKFLPNPKLPRSPPGTF